jgi:hypothetical protein
MAKVEFFYDYSSPWTYLAFTKIHGICQKYGATLEWRPILVGGIFNTVNPSRTRRTGQSEILGEGLAGLGTVLWDNDQEPDGFPGEFSQSFTRCGGGARTS